ncbi:MAG TPA: hypothetical protein VMU39_30220 [Solirubrobacteraceae bacterium]|nr:hypothetical protein [Solirubrobacteraceae bacterium]
MHALSAACPAPASPPPPPKDTTPPTISRFSATHTRFAVGPKPTALTAAARRKTKPKPKIVGTTFTFALSEAARTQIVITQTVTGHRATRTKPCRAARRGQKHNCTFKATLLTLVRAHLRAGTNRVAFSGRYGHKRLAKGTYTATITATDAAGNRSRARSLTITVVG